MNTQRKSKTQPQRILLVDDNYLGNLIRKALLQEHGYTVQTALSGQEALQILLRCSFDLIVTDLRMPEMDGVALIRELRASGSTVPIVLLSGFALGMGLTEELTGADAVISKSNLESVELPRTVRNLLGRRITRKPAASQKAKSAAASVARSG